MRAWLFCPHLHACMAYSSMASDAGTPGLPQVTLTYSYDPNGNRTSMSDSLGGVVSYTYDLANQLTNLALGGTVASPQQVAFAYDPAGNMTGLTREYNQSGTWVAAATSSYTYDAANQTTGIVDKNSSGTTLVSYAYTYDLAGRVTQESRGWAAGASTDTLTYGYTNNNQLTSVSHTNAAFANESFSYDANGNQTGTGYTTAAGNEQTASPGYTYTYDANGNMITSTQTSTGDVWTYGYDFRDQMTSAVEKSSTGTILAQATFTYDALDNRIGVDENGVQTWTLYDGSSPIMDFSGSGSLETRYLNGPAGQLVDTVLSRESAAGAVAWYLPDRLGTVRDLVSNAGSIIDHVDFSAFGTVLGETAPTVGDRFMGFAGLVRDSVTGLNLAVMRAQNPGTGRWTSQDPIGFAGGDANLYRYVGNGPNGGVDPTGLQVAGPMPMPPIPGKNLPEPMPPIDPGLIRAGGDPCESAAYKKDNAAYNQAVQEYLEALKQYQLDQTTFNNLLPLLTIGVPPFGGNVQYPSGSHPGKPTMTWITLWQNYRTALDMYNTALRWSNYMKQAYPDCTQTKPFTGKPPNEPTWGPIIRPINPGQAPQPPGVQPPVRRRRWPRLFR